MPTCSVDNYPLSQGTNAMVPIGKRASKQIRVKRTLLSALALPGHWKANRILSARFWPCGRVAQIRIPARESQLVRRAAQVPLGERLCRLLLGARASPRDFYILCVTQAGGLPAISRWLSGATPPVNNIPPTRSPP